MKHSSTRELYTYWNERRGTRPAPERDDIDPAAIRKSLGDAFVLANSFSRKHHYRLAGTRVCALFGREMKGEIFSAAWEKASQQALDELLTIVGDEAVGVVAGANAYNAQGDAVELELLLLPLAHRGHARVRALGVLAPIERPYWLGTLPVENLTLTALRHLDPAVEAMPAPTLSRVEPEEIAGPNTPLPDGAQVRHGFVVYEGGRRMSASERLARLTGR
ncbi:MAG TPA: PAS domain-containing protein [Pseudolabrys sp.]|nr:PAS domain-containing protein [Pseudolabrys sp.]